MNTINLHELRHTSGSPIIKGTSFTNPDTGKFGTINIKVGKTEIVIFMEMDEYLSFCSDHNIDHQK